MTLGVINGVPIESILQRIPNANLREAYQNALEHFSAEHPSLLQNPEELARYLNPRVMTHAQGITYTTLAEQVGHGRLHADEYVAAAYLLASVSSRYGVSNGLFRMNPLRAEHLILLQEQENSLGPLRRVNPQNRVEMLTALRDANELGDGVLEFIRHFGSLSPAIQNAWSALEVYQDHGVQTGFLDLRNGLEFPENFYRQHLAHLGVFEVEDLKPEVRARRIEQCREEPEEPACAPNDPSCGD